MKVVKNTMGENLFSLSSVESGTTASRTANIEMVDKAKLCVNQNFQRPIDMRRARSIASNWDWRLCMPLIVCRNGKNSFSIIDGDHRYAASMMLENVTELPCLIYEKMAEKTQAKLFIDSNSNSKPLKALDYYKAGVVAKDPYCLLIEQWAKKYGIAIGKSKHKNCPQLSCVGSISYGIKNMGAEIIEKAFEIVKALGYCNGNFDVVTFSTIVMGFAYFPKEKWAKIQKDVIRVGYNHFHLIVDNHFKSARAGVRLDRVRLVMVDVFIEAINYRKKESDRWTL